MEPHRTHLLAGLAALRESAECARASARRTLGAVLEAMVLAVLVRLLRRLERQIRALPDTQGRADAHPVSTRPDSVHPAGTALPRWYRRNPRGGLRRVRRLAAWIGSVCRGLPGRGMRPAAPPPPARHPKPPARSPPRAHPAPA